MTFLENLAVLLKGMAFSNLKAYNVLQCVFFFFPKEEHFLIICSYSRYKREITQENQLKDLSWYGTG